MRCACCRALQVPVSPSLRGEVAVAKRAGELALGGEVGRSWLTSGSRRGRMARCLLSDNVVDPELQLRPLPRFMCPALVPDLEAAVLPCQRKFRSFLQEQRQQPIVQYLESVGENPEEWLAQFDASARGSARCGLRQDCHVTSQPRDGTS